MFQETFVTFEDWLRTVPPEITWDALWQMTVYRQALYLGELAWFDICILATKRQMLGVSEQLYRAVGSISANIAEGYSKASHKDQARFYEYALGSAREARDWYYKARHVLGEEATLHRMRLIVQIIRQLLKLIPEYRGRRIGEELDVYVVSSLNQLLNNAPLPHDDQARNT
jgi:four helix bundle protein